MNDRIGASAVELADAIRDGEISAEAVLDAHLEQIHDSEGLNAFVTVIEEEARARAREADEAAAAGEDLGPLHGVPVAIKDLMQRKAGVRNTLGLAALSGNVADAVRSRALCGWLVGRVGGGARLGHDGRRHRVGHRGVAPRAGFLL